MKCSYFSLLLFVHLALAIYNPEDLTVKPLTVKKTTWRKAALTPQEVEMHHGYSRVQRIIPQKSTYQPSNRQPKIDPQWHNTVPLENKTEKPVTNKENVEKRPEQQIRKETTTESPEYSGIEKLDIKEENRYTEVKIGSRFNKLDEEVIQIDDKLAPMEEKIQIHDKLDKLDTSSSEVHETKLTPSTGLSNIPQVEGEIDVFGFHWPPRDYEVYPFKKQAKPYANMAFEKCPKMVTGPLVFQWSCSQFLNCYKGRGVISNCAPGTLFNPESLECDYPEKVTCITGTHNQQVKSEKLVAASKELTCPKSFSGLMAHPNDCTKFLNCNSGSTYVQTCGPGTVFNPKISACDHPYNSECNYEVSNLPSVEDNEYSYDLRMGRNHQRLPTLKEVQKNYSSNYDLTVGETRSHGSYQAGPGRQFHIFSSQAGSSGDQSRSNFGQIMHPKPAQYTQISNCPKGGCQSTGSTQNYQFSSSGSSNFGQIMNQGGSYAQGPGCQQPGGCPQGSPQTPGCQQSGGCPQSSPQTPGCQQSGGCPQGFGQGGSTQGFSQSGSTQGFSQSGSTHYSQGGSTQGFSPGGSTQGCQQPGGCPQGSTQTPGCQQSGGCPQGFNQGGSTQGFSQSGSTHFSQGSTHGYSQGGSTQGFSHGTSTQGFHQGGPQSSNCQQSGGCHQSGNFGLGSSNFDTVMSHHTHFQAGKINCPPLETLQGAASSYSGQYVAQGSQNVHSSRAVEDTGSIKCPPGQTGLVAHPFICEKFLNCANGRTHVQDCGPGTVFNPKIQACDWPKNVNCKSQRGGNQQFGNYQSRSSGSSGREIEFSSSQRGAASQQHLSFANMPQECQEYYRSQTVQRGSPSPGFSPYSSRGHGKAQPIPTWMPKGQPTQRPYGSRQPPPGFTPTYTYTSSVRTYPTSYGHHVPQYIPQRPMPTTPRVTYSMTSSHSHVPGKTHIPGRPIYSTTSSVSSSRGVPGYTNGHSIGSGVMYPSPSVPVYFGTPIGTGFGEPGQPNYGQKVPPSSGHHKVTIHHHSASTGQEKVPLGTPYGPQGFGGSTGCQNCSQGGCPGCPTGEGQQKVPLGTPYPQNFGGTGCQGCTPGQSCPGCPEAPKGYDDQHKVPVYFGTGQPNVPPSPKGRQPVDSYPAESEVDHHKVPFDFGPGKPNNSDGPKPSVDYEDFEGMSKVPVDYIPETTTRSSYTPIFTHSTPNYEHTIYIQPRPDMQPPRLPPLNGTIYIRPSIPNIQTQGFPGNRDPVPSYHVTEPNPTESRFRPLTTTEKTFVHVQRIPPRGTNGSSAPNWPPPFPSTDIAADYNFDDGVGTTTVPSRSTQKYWKTSNFCGEDQFECGIRDCIPRNWVCNGIQDCPNGADEKNCSIYLTHFTLIPNSRLFKHELEKWLNTDLDTCSSYCLNSKGFQCKSFNYRREDKVCLLCDTNVGLSGALAPSMTYDYYELKDFTVDCSKRYECSNKKCIDFNQVCDGKDDCGNRQDEKNCDPTTIGYEIRLAGSHNPNEGRIEIKVFDEWGYICDDQFGLRDAHVACKELGYHLGALEVKTSSWFATEIKDNDTYYLMDDVSCLGNETSLRDCDFNGWGVHNCMPQEIVGVICKTPQATCPENEWQCDTGKECLPVEYVCDGVFDCEDQSDEGIQHCQAPIEIRLANGSSKMEGRVEIKYHGMWGTVCDDDFNDAAARVICRSLGYYGSAIAKKDGAFGPGIGPIWLDQVNCAGNESFIQDCLHWHWGEHNCEHKEDAAVICSKSEDAMLEKRSRDRAEIDLDSINTISSSESLHPIKCGHRNEDVPEDNKDYSFRVVSGSTAKKGEYPWQATIRVKGKTKSAHWCGAVIISNKFLLTAAHCLVGFAKGAYFIRAGDYDVDTQEGTEVEAYIEDFFIHEKFRQGGHMNNDIALIKLKGNGLRMSKHVQPICLPEKDTIYREGMNCTISGFGSTQTGKSTSSRILRAGWVPIQKQDICKLESVYGKAITDGMICAGSLDEGVDSCDGDSGGPLACLDKGLFTLYGITSWGQHCGHANKPGVYVKIAYYRDWIDKKIEENS